MRVEVFGAGPTTEEPIYFLRPRQWAVGVPRGTDPCIYHSAGWYLKGFPSLGVLRVTTGLGSLFTIAGLSLWLMTTLFARSSRISCHTILTIERITSSNDRTLSTTTGASIMKCTQQRCRSINCNGLLVYLNPRDFAPISPKSHKRPPSEEGDS